MSKLNTQSIDIFAIPGIQDLTNEDAAAVTGGAGPFTLAPGEQEEGIGTFLFGLTTMTVDSSAAGFVEIQAGSSPAETVEIQAGRNVIERSFAAAPLNFTNMTDNDITLITQ